MNYVQTYNIMLENTTTIKKQSRDEGICCKHGVREDAAEEMTAEVSGGRVGGS